VINFVSISRKKKDEGFCYILDKYKYENIWKLFKIRKFDDQDGDNEDLWRNTYRLLFLLIFITIILFVINIWNNIN